jgi:hydroxymethylpyrimidine/phosphomethylpyrimidine kinase
MTMPVALTIAGSDSGGGAGIQADLKTFHAFGVFGTTAITAITVQDTVGVHGVHAVPVDVVRRQIEVVARDLAPAACKTGMLATAEVVAVVAAAIRGKGWEITSWTRDGGDEWGPSPGPGRGVGGVELLMPLCAAGDAEPGRGAAADGAADRDEAEMRAAGERLVAAGAGAALVKGGHLAGDEVVDVLVDEEGLMRRGARADRHEEHARDGVHGVGGGGGGAGPRPWAAGSGGGRAGFRPPGHRGGAGARLGPRPAEPLRRGPGRLRVASARAPQVGSGLLGLRFEVLGDRGSCPPPPTTGEGEEGAPDVHVHALQPIPGEERVGAVVEEGPGLLLPEDVLDPAPEGGGAVPVQLEGGPVQEGVHFRIGVGGELVGPA